jgi:RNA recognition motif-containing protein
MASQPPPPPPGPDQQGGPMPPQGSFPQSLPPGETGAFFVTVLVAHSACAWPGMTPEAYQAYYQQYYQYYMMAMQQQQLMAQQSQGGGPPAYHAPPPSSAPSGPPPPPPDLTPPPLEQIPTSVLWVGLPSSGINEDDLRPVFSAFGMLELIKMIAVKNCAFVHFADKVDAWRALTTLSRNPQTIRGVSFRLGWGKADQNSGGGGDRGDRGGIGGSSLPLAPPSNSLWLGSVPFDITEDELYGPFARFGTIDNIRLLPQKKCAFITFSNVAEAELAMREMQGQLLRGERLKINFGHGGTGGGKKGDEELRLAPVPEVGPPPNKDVAFVIEQLATFVHRLGSAFEEKVKDVQKANPRFEFLFGGPGHDYFEWRKYDLKEKENLATSHLAPWQRASASSSAASANDVVLSVTDTQRLGMMLDHLEPTQESIRDAKVIVFFFFCRFLLTFFSRIGSWLALVLPTTLWPCFAPRWASFLRFRCVCTRSTLSMTCCCTRDARRKIFSARRFSGICPICAWLRATRRAFRWLPSKRPRWSI